MDTLTRDAYIEAVLGARLRFHARPGASAAYWSAVYKRWAQLYAGDRWRKCMEEKEN